MKGCARVLISSLKEGCVLSQQCVWAVVTFNPVDVECVSLESLLKGPEHFLGKSECN
jgi:hypothetical protein